MECTNIIPDRFPIAGLFKIKLCRRKIIVCGTPFFCIRRRGKGKSEKKFVITVKKLQLCTGFYPAPVVQWIE